MKKTSEKEMTAAYYIYNTDSQTNRIGDKSIFSKEKLMPR
jgi:hypothetical protein